MSEIKEGDLYKIFEIEGVRFEIHYGYECESERKFGEVSPVYPDFIKNPQYTPDGYRFSIAYQIVCEHYSPIKKSADEWCEACKHYESREECTGICRCPENRKR